MKPIEDSRTRQRKMNLRKTWREEMVEEDLKLDLEEGKEMEEGDLGADVG